MDGNMHRADAEATIPAALVVIVKIA